MNKLLIAFTILSTQAFAQKPETIYPLNLQPHDQQYYTTQAKLWGEVTKTHPKDAAAWKNYYCASRYSMQMYLPDQGADKQKIMEDLVNNMEKNVPNSVEYCVCKTSLMGNATKDTTTYLRLIRSGLATNPKEPGLLESYINYYEIHGHTEKLKDLYVKLFFSETFCQGITNCAYNILMSLDNNAIVFVSGDNDTYPLRMAQEVMGVRKDVTIINTYLSSEFPSYTKRLLKEKNIYISDDILNKGKDSKEGMGFIKTLVLEINKTAPSVPLFFDIFSDAEMTFPDSLYCTGLAWKFSTTRIDNVSLLKNNIEFHFLLNLDPDFHHDEGISTQLVEEMNTSYITPFAILYKHYLETGESSYLTGFYKNYITKYATKMGKEKEMEEYLEGKRGSL